MNTCGPWPRAAGVLPAAILIGVMFALAKGFA